MKMIKKKLLSGIAICLVGLCICACIPKTTTPNKNANVSSEEITARNDDEALNVIIAV